MEGHMLLLTLHPNFPLDLQTPHRSQRERNHATHAVSAIAQVDHDTAARAKESQEPRRAKAVCRSKIARYSIGKQLTLAQLAEHETVVDPV
jgi:hypothetical protein